VDDTWSVEILLGTWTWTRLSPTVDVSPLDLESLETEAMLREAHNELEIDWIDWVDWWPEYYRSTTAHYENGSVTVLPVGGQIDWGQIYAYDSGWVEGKWDEALTVLKIFAMQDIDLGGGFGEHREMEVIAILEVSVVPGNPQIVEFRDQGTGDLVLRLEAVDPLVTADQLVTAAASCTGLGGCPMVVWRLFVEFGDGIWVDPPWIGIPVDNVAIVAGGDGFIIVAIGRSPNDPSVTLYTWGSANGFVWDELHPAHPIELPVNTEIERLFLVGDGDRLVMGLDYDHTPFHGALVMTSTEGRDWRPVDVNRRLTSLNAVARIKDSWIFLTGESISGGWSCAVWISADGIGWERIPFLGQVHPGVTSQCGVVGDSVFATAYDLWGGDVWWSGGIEE
jgi:hypothetical protein